MFIPLLRKELRVALRARLFYTLTFVYSILLCFAFANSNERLANYQVSKAAAEKLMKQEWEALDQNPHAAAHVGTYLFRPVHALQLMDPGLSDYLGTSYRVEAHRQHEPNYAEANESGGRIRFGDLSPAYLLQVILPLFLLLLAHNCLSREREQGTLPLLLIQAPQPFVLLLAKASAYALFGLLWLSLTAVGAFATILYADMSIPWSALLGLFSAYATFAVLISFSWVFISACSRNSLYALVICLTCWTIWAVIIPRAVSIYAETHIVLPSRYVFNKKIEDGFFKGIDGDGNAAARRKQLLRDLLKQYQVDTVTQLPVNFEGLSMQAAEDYNSRVYRHYADSLEIQLLEQEAVTARYSLLNPFTAVRALSMDLAAADLRHYLQFLHQAQKYRDGFMRRLNMDMAKHADNRNPYAYKPSPDFYKQLPPFRPETAEDSTYLYRYALTLLGWSIALMIGFLAISRTINANAK
ncbi:DUF3526 domain-containing protein [Olivibacter jilunii]|uniref:DUF3526 domain-containing protein n=1 Tax=Olivibacter jilunii TaxID=985016 RepID=UPI003F172AEF